MTNRKFAPMFTWLIILGGAEVERSLGALQTHLSPVRDGLQLHSVTAVLLQSLQIHPALSLWQQNTCMLAFCMLPRSTWDLFQSPVIVPVIVPAELSLGQPGTVGKPCLLKTHVELGKVSWRGDSLQGHVREPCYQSLPGLPHCVWLAAFHHQRELDEFLLLTVRVLTFLYQQAAFKAPRCQSGNQ